MFGHELLLELPAGTLQESTGEDYVRARALLSYPESYVKLGITLEKTVTIYAKFAAKPQAEAASYLKAIPAMQSAVDIYMKFEIGFPQAPQRYLKTAAAFISRGDQYVRFSVRFAVNADYLKVKAALVKSPILSDLPEGSPANKLGLLSRQYISLSSVKKEI